MAHDKLHVVVTDSVLCPLDTECDLIMIGLLNGTGCRTYTIGSGSISTIQIASLLTSMLRHIEHHTEAHPELNSLIVALDQIVSKRKEGENDETET
jgi:hypothetical protein